MIEPSPVCHCDVTALSRTSRHVIRCSAGPGEELPLVSVVVHGCHQGGEGVAELGQRLRVCRGTAGSAAAASTAQANMGG